MRRIIHAAERESGVFDVHAVPSDRRVVIEAGAYDRPGTAAGPAPMELMLASLATCSTSTFGSILERMRLSYQRLEVFVDAERSERPPRVWTLASVIFVVTTDAPNDRLLHAVELTERTCSASVMLAAVMQIESGVIQIGSVEPANTRRLRHQVLRSGQPADTVGFDREDEAVWVGALHEGRVVGCGAVFASPTPEDADAWQLRAMAVESRMRGMGIGEAIRDELVNRARAAGVTTLWCLARTPAVAFYERGGWSVISEEFEVPDNGPHRKMIKSL